MATFTFAQLCAPRAAADTNWVKEDSSTSTTGNVLQSIAHPGAPQGTFADAADTDLNLDTLFVVGVNGSPVTTGTVINGQYGRLTINSDGSYLYALYTLADNPSAFAAVQKLVEGETLSETFDYDVGDGQFTSTASLSVTIFGSDDRVSLTGLGVTGGDQIIYENDLATGTSPDAAGLTKTGSFNFSAPDGIETLSIGGTSLITDGVVNNLNTPIQTAFGTITITAINLATGTVSYVYTLGGNVTHDAGQGANTIFDKIDVFATDRDGSSASSAINVVIIDDVPTGANVTASAVLDDEGLSGGIEGGIGDAAGALTSISGSLGYQVGADGFGSLVLTGPKKLGTETVTSTFDQATKTLTISSARGAIAQVVVTDVATGAYTVTLLQPVLHTKGNNENDALLTVGYTITDSDKDSATGSLTVTINDDSPVAANDGTIASVTECARKVIIGTKADLLQNDAFGADGAISSGSFVIATGSLGGKVTVDAAGNLVYTNTSVKLRGDAVTTETFTYTIKDRDCDTATATFSVTISDAGVTIGAAPENATVDEDDLPIGLHDGAPGDDATSASGVIKYTIGKDGFKDVALSASTAGLQKLDGTAVNTVWDATTRTLTGYGTDASDVVFRITLSGVTSSSANYTVTLLQPVSHAGTHPGFEDNLSFTVGVTVTDRDGSTGTTSFLVTIDDDMPVAVHDFDAITKGQGGVADGNVITGIGGVDANTDDGVADGIGADGFGAISWENQTANTVAGHYGTLTVGADGSYSYLLDEGNQDIKTLLDGQTLKETFYYTITDSEGDTCTASLTLTIHGATTVVDEGDGPTEEPEGPAPIASIAAVWVPSDPADQTLANPKYGDGYPLFISVPHDANNDTGVVTATSVPQGIVFFDAATSSYVPLTDGTTIYDPANGIDFLGGLLYTPTADATDAITKPLVLSIGFPSGTVVAAVELHEFTGTTVDLGGIPNLVYGTSGDTTFNGGAADDIIMGRDGADIIHGGAGDDILTGGLGIDTLSGGTGADIFVFGSLGDSPSLAEADTITDFELNQAGEVIDLNLIDADASTAGNEAFASVSKSTTLVANAVTFFFDGGNTIVQADVDGDITTAELVFKITGQNELTAGDFIL